MKIGIGLNCYPCPLSEQIALMKKYGFSATFTGSDGTERDDAIIACKAAGIEVENLHAPFKNINAVWEDTEEGADCFSLLLSGVDRCVLHGIPTIVVHLSNGCPAPQVNEIGMKRFSDLIAYAKERGVTIAFENIRTLGNLALAFEEFPDAAFCWDVGHETAFTHGREYMPLFGDRIAALHVHDNGKIHDKDEHLIPFDGAIDFDRVARYLATVGYEKSLMLELLWRNRPRYEALNADAYYARAARAATRIAEAVDKYRVKNRQTSTR